MNWLHWAAVIAGLVMVLAVIPICISVMDWGIDQERRNGRNFAWLFILTVVVMFFGPAVLLNVGLSGLHH